MATDLEQSISGEYREGVKRNENAFTRKARCDRYREPLGYEGRYESFKDNFKERKVSEV